MKSNEYASWLLRNFYLHQRRGRLRNIIQFSKVSCLFIFNTHLRRRADFWKKWPARAAGNIRFPKVSFIVILYTQLSRRFDFWEILPARVARAHRKDYTILKSQTCNPCIRSTEYMRADFGNKITCASGAGASRILSNPDTPGLFWA